MFSMKKIISILILTLFLTLFAPSVLADGGFFPPVYYNEDIFEPTQKGIILHDGTQEQLIIQATYKGEMDDFAWIIPVPSYPDIDKTSSYLFEELHFLTQPDYKRAPRLFQRTIMYASEGMTKSMDSLGNSVTVHEQRQIGIYNVTVLSSRDPKSLLNWLSENEYRVSLEAESILDFYIQKKWYFIAMRVNLAPLDEKLIASLNKINPSITDSTDAVTILTDDLVKNIISEKNYNDQTAIRTTELDYGQDEDEDPVDYRYRYLIEEKPKVLITKDEYDRFYEQYNGYFENHIKNEINNKIQYSLNREIMIPDSWDCYNNRYRTDIAYSRCYIWYFTKDSEEYQLLKDASCGKYCSLISEDKDQYTIDDLAKVGANAIIKGDDSLKTYFGVIDEKRNWYDNNQDQFNYVENQVKGRLHDSLRDNKSSLSNRLLSELFTKYSLKTGSTFRSMSEVSMHFTEKTLADFKQDMPFSTSYIYGFGLMTNQEYDLLNSYFEGDHDIVNLKNNIEATVKKVVFWKKETVQKELDSGTVQPLLIKFATSDIIYPLKISSINKGASEILLYVFAKYRTEVEGIDNFKVEYAKWIEPEDLKTDSYYSYLDMIKTQSQEKTMHYYYWSPNTYYYLNQILDDRYFLTKFRKEMWPKEMTDDLLLTQAGNNDEYKLTVYENNYVWYWISFMLALFILWGIMFAVCLMLRCLNNRIISDDKSLYYASTKRCSVYALTIPVLIFISIISPNTIGKLISDLVELFEDIFEFIFHLFNYIGLPQEINGLFVFILAIAFIFLLIHLICSLLISLYSRIKER